MDIETLERWHKKFLEISKPDTLIEPLREVIGIEYAMEEQLIRYSRPTREGLMVFRSRKQAMQRGSIEYVNLQQIIDNWELHNAESIFNPMEELKEFGINNESEYLSYPLHIKIPQTIEEYALLLRRVTIESGIQIRVNNASKLIGLISMLGAYFTMKRIISREVYENFRRDAI